MIFFVSSKSDQSKWKLSEVITDPLCVFKILRTLPHYDETRYSFKINGEWIPFQLLEESNLTEHHLRNVEAFKFLPGNEIIWNRTERNLSFTPY